MPYSHPELRVAWGHGGSLPSQTTDATKLPALETTTVLPRMQVIPDAQWIGAPLSATPENGFANYRKDSDRLEALSQAMAQVQEELQRERDSNRALMQTNESLTKARETELAEREASIRAAQEKAAQVATAADLAAKVDRELQAARTAEAVQVAQVAEEAKTFLEFENEQLKRRIEAFQEQMQHEQEARESMESIADRVNSALARLDIDERIGAYHRDDGANSPTLPPTPGVPLAGVPPPPLLPSSVTLAAPAPAPSLAYQAMAPNTAPAPALDVTAEVSAAGTAQAHSTDVNLRYWGTI